MVAGQGASVVVAALTEQSARAAADELSRQGANVRAASGDLGEPGVAASLMATAIRNWGRVDAVVHCAAAFHREPLIDMTDEDWDHVLRTCLHATFSVARDAARAMGGDGGDIVLLSSMWGAIGGPGRGAYGAAKAGVDMLARVAAAEWSSLGIRVYSVAPGWVRTDKTTSLIEQGRLQLSKMTRIAPARPLVEMQEVASLCASLAAGEHPMLSGTVVRLDGGMTGWSGDV